VGKRKLFVQSKKVKAIFDAGIGEGTPRFEGNKNIRINGFKRSLHDLVLNSDMEAI
jgi:hypothetical protein